MTTLTMTPGGHPTPTVIDPESPAEILKSLPALYLREARCKENLAERKSYDAAVALQRVQQEIEAARDKIKLRVVK